MNAKDLINKLRMSKKAFIAGVVDQLVTLFIGIGVLTIVVVLIAMIGIQTQTTIQNGISGFNVSNTATYTTAYNLTAQGLTNINTANGYVGLFITVAIFVLLLSMVMLLRAATGGQRM
jgi:hypothetical protein